MEYTLINKQAIEENMFSDKGMIKQFIDLYISQIPIDFQSLFAAIDRQALNDIGNAAHHIKPTMVYIGALTIKDKLQQIESLARVSADITAIAELYADLKTTYELLIQELKAYYATL